MIGRLLNNSKLLKKQQQDAIESGRVPTLPAGEDRYLGDATCQRCHASIYEHWKTTKHAKGWQTLVDNKADGDPACIVCHVVGFKQPSGFISAGATLVSDTLYPSPSARSSVELEDEAG